MDTETERLLLGHIENQWRSLGDLRPWGMWIAHHAPIPAGTNWLDYRTSSTLQVWFLQESGLQPRNRWEFQRFFVVHFLQPWCAGQSREPDGIFGEEQFPIGIARFAEYIGNKEFYLEVSYGKLYGRGYRLAIAEGSVASSVHLWWS